VVSELSQGLDNGVLRLGLSGINDVVDLCDIAEVGVVGLAVFGRYPALMAIRIGIKLAITKIASEQAELPHVIRDVFADVADGSVRAADDFLIFFGNIWTAYVHAVKSFDRREEIILI